MTNDVTTEAVAENTSDAAATSNPTDTPATAAAPEGQQQQASEKAEDKPQGAPEAYEFTAPEGKEYSPEMLAKFSEAAKESNLTQEAAQKMLDRLAPAVAERQMNALAEAHKEWVATTKADSEIGGDKLAENLAVAQTTFDRFGTPELRKLLDESGLGDHPELIRWAHRVGKAMSEDKFVAGRTNAEPARTPQKLYSASNMNP